MKKVKGFFFKWDRELIEEMFSKAKSYRFDIMGIKIGWYRIALINTRYKNYRQPIWVNDKQPIFPFKKMKPIIKEHGVLFTRKYWLLSKQENEKYYVFIRPAPGNVLKLESNYNSPLMITHHPESIEYKKIIAER